MDAAIIGATASSFTFILGLFAFWYNFVGQSPIIESRPHSFSAWPGTKEKTVNVEFVVRNRRKHYVYVRDPRISFIDTDLVVLSIKHHSCEPGPAGFTLSKNVCEVNLYVELAPGQVLRFKAGIEVRHGDAETAIEMLRNSHGSRYAPHIRITIKEYTPRIKSYIISDFEH